ncbi:DNA internalization-related competence protein ComEC/Rec2 [Kangiella sp. HZ709]|uniref:DNA internalization-related competence protein ComEC/Rec2 n=1 Tax=Kangiella sp. HZ709 TaxID=2666328 RepID=UPI0012AFAFEA|nr:DNA internalization-related competence protein ComEC/Rec2 [Kangiella sp. HZ709]MRX26946.1 DNA internalization-related competence protein ComEC/Rec2 [Kangiella sp. HZ709]
MLKWILGFLIGCCSIFWLKEPFLLLESSLIIIAILFLLVVLGRIKKESYRLKTGLLISLGFAAGVAWLNIHSQLRLSKQIREPLTESHIIEAKVVSIPQVYDGLIVFKAKVLTSDKQNLKGLKLKFSWYQYKDRDVEKLATVEIPKLGELWQFKVSIKPITSALNIAGYDAERQAFLESISGKANIKNGDAKRLSLVSNFSIYALRQLIYERLSEHENAGIFQALLIGEKSLVSAKQRQIIQALGISHLLAISGLHISIIAGLCFWLSYKTIIAINKLGFSISPIYISGVISLLAAISYSALAGFSIATVRAMIMWGVFILAISTSSHNSLIRALAIAALMVLLFDPVSVLSYGFWLTFLSIVIIGTVLFGRVTSQSKFLLGVKVQWHISLGMALLVVFMFQQISLISFAINLVLIPVFSILLLPLIFISILLEIFFDVNYPIAVIDNALSSIFSWINVESLKSLGLFLKAYIIKPMLFLLLLIYLFLLIPIGKLKALPIMALCLTILTITLNQKKDLVYKLLVFDVGHGSANLIYNDEYAILYDTGFANDGFSYAESTLIPTIRKLGIKQINLIIISHKDLDHSGGAKAIQNAFVIDEVIDSSSCQQLNHFSFKALQLVSFSYKSFNNLKPNNSSCVVKVIIRNTSILLTGDIEKEAEKYLLNNDSNQLKADVLISPHHGSNTSSTYPFIKTVDAPLVIHSTDRFNRYGFPKDAVLKRYSEMHYRQLSTGCAGMVTIKLGSLELQTEKMRQHRRIWRLKECQL